MTKSPSKASSVAGLAGTFRYRVKETASSLAKKRVRPTTAAPRDDIRRANTPSRVRLPATPLLASYVTDIDAVALQPAGDAGGAREQVLRLYADTLTRVMRKVWVL